MIHVRQAMPKDAMAVAEAHIRSWQEGYRGLMAQDYLDALRPEDRASRYTFDTVGPNVPYTLVAVDGTAVRGHVTIGHSRDSDLDAAGEIWALYVDPPHWGTGVGRTLMTAGCAHLRGAGHRLAGLWVLADNARARRFYERAGWTADGSERTEAIGGDAMREVRYLAVLR